MTSGGSRGSRRSGFRANHCPDCGGSTVYGHSTEDCRINKESNTHMMQIFNDRRDTLAAGKPYFKATKTAGEIVGGKK